jgi:hypothetical protein
MGDDVPERRVELVGDEEPVGGERLVGRRLDAPTARVVEDRGE